MNERITELEKQLAILKAQLDELTRVECVLRIKGESQSVTLLAKLPKPAPVFTIVK